jgi:hypothetical protein
MWSVVARRLAAPSKPWLMSSTRVAPKLLDQATGKRIATVEELRALCEACEQVHCTIETVTDPSKKKKFGRDQIWRERNDVTKVLHTPPGKVAVEWAGLQTALAQLEHEGLLRGPVTAELRDVLLYSPGDYYKPHTKGTKKGPKHLMTLAVDTGLCPPSSDGELVLGDYNDLKEEWLPGSAGSFCAWGTHVENEVTPLLSGNRCVAVYDVSAEEFNEGGLEKRKLDSIVDALRSLVKEKANESFENTTKTHVGFLLKRCHVQEKSVFQIAFKRAVVQRNFFCREHDEIPLLKALEYGFGVPKEDLQVVAYVSLTGKRFRGVHGDYVKEVPISNTKEVSQTKPVKKQTTRAVTNNSSVVTVLAVDPEAKSPVQRYVVPAECYNSTWMLNADYTPDTSCYDRIDRAYFGYDATTVNGTNLYLSCSSYLRVPRKYFPELNVPQERGRSAESEEEDQHGKNTAGPGKDKEGQADAIGNSK